MPLLRRWPTLAALLAAVLVWFGNSGDTAGAVEGLGAAVLLLPLEYVILNQLGRRAASWPVLGGIVVAVFVVELLDVLPLQTAVLAAALVLLIAGGITGTPNGRKTFSVQAAGMVLFGALALIGLAVDPGVGKYVVAAGWLLHGAWDVVHWRRNSVVSRSYAEACGILDISVGLLLVFVL